MVAAAATSAFFVAPSPDTSSIRGTKPGTCLTTLGVKGSKCSGSLKMQASAAPPKINGTPVNIATPGRVKKTHEDTSPSPPPRTFINQLPDWSMLLAAITTAFLAAEKQWMMIDWKPKRADMLMDTLSLGRIVEDGLIFRQNFSIRSYEIGADRTASIETVMNHLQETALNHVIGAGLLDSGFGSTPEMYKRNLIWVVTKMQVMVNRYPTWGETVQVDTWVCGSGKNSTRRGWLVSNSQTGEILTRASSVWVMMNKQTRKLSKIPEEVRNEIEPYFFNSAPVVDEDTRKLLKVDDTTADVIRNGLTPRWNDLDVNQHVNNVKYIGWIVESAPASMLESHELCSLTVEYRRECGKDSVLQSLTAVHPLDNHKVECEHLLRLENGAEILRARTQWRPKLTGKNSNAEDGGFPANNV